MIESESKQTQKELSLSILDEVEAALEKTSYDLACSRSRCEQNREAPDEAHKNIDLAWKRVNAICELLRLSRTINRYAAVHFSRRTWQICKDYLVVCVKELKRLGASYDDRR